MTDYIKSYDEHKSHLPWDDIKLKANNFFIIQSVSDFCLSNSLGKRKNSDKRKNSFYIFEQKYLRLKIVQAVPTKIPKYKSGIMHSCHCKGLAVTATFFKRLPLKKEREIITMSAATIKE